MHAFIDICIKEREQRRQQMNALNKTMFEFGQAISGSELASCCIWCSFVVHLTAWSASKRQQLNILDRIMVNFGQFISSII